MLIATADANGNFRMAEMNRQVEAATHRVQRGDAKSRIGAECWLPEKGHCESDVLVPRTM